MFCPQCGKEYSERVNFCCQCGAAILAAGPAPAKKLMRSRRESKIAGVCGGFAEYADVDVTLVRIFWLMLAFLWGWGLIGYLIAWIVMPIEPLPEPKALAAAPATPQPAASH